MPNIKTWSLGVLLATVLLLVVGVFSPAPVLADSSNTTNSVCDSPADSSTPGDGYTAPAPTKLDASGSDQDGYCIPEADFEGYFDHPIYGYGGYHLNGAIEALDAGFHKLAKGVTDVTITSDWHSGGWYLNFPNDETGKEAENKYRVVVSHSCDFAAGAVYREVTAYFTNVDDDTDRYVHSIYPRSTTKYLSVYGTETVGDIKDGETVAIPLRATSDIPGLRPATYQVKFWRSDTGYAGDGPEGGGYVVKKFKVRVPNCPVHTDDGVGNPSASKKARGNLKRVGCKVVKVTADTRGFSAAPKASYKVLKKLRGHKAKTRNFAVKAGQRRGLVVKKPRHSKGSMVLKVKRGNKWTTLDRVWVPRCR